LLHQFQKYQFHVLVIRVSAVINFILHELKLLELCIRLRYELFSPEEVSKPLPLNVDSVTLES